MTDTMLAAVYHGPNDLRVERRPAPQIASDEVLLRVESASICATDLRILAGGHRKYRPGVTRILGHEVAGVIEEAGANVEGLRRGQRVFVAPNIGCGECRECRNGNNNLCRCFEAFGITLDGAFARYMRVTAAAIRQGNVIPLPDTMEFDAMALAEPFACVLRGQNAVSVSPGDSVLVMGAGPIGLMHVLLAKQRGAQPVMVSDLVPARLTAALQCGADTVIDIREQELAEQMRPATDGRGADVVIVAAPAHKAMEQAVRVAALQGRINYFAGLPKQESEIRLDANAVHYGELRITGTTACSTGDCRRAVELICSGQVDVRPLIGARYSLRDALAAFDQACSRTGLKVMIQPGRDEG